jgi:hypothetical protein
MWHGMTKKEENDIGASSPPFKDFLEFLGLFEEFNSIAIEQRPSR